MALISYFCPDIRRFLMSKKISSVAAAAMIVAAVGTARSASAQEQTAQLRRSYDFGQALEQCTSLLQDAGEQERQALEDEQVLCQNALSMMGYCSHPTVIARHNFSLQDFFLYYPLPQDSWRAVPNMLDSLSTEPLVTGMYLPADAGRIYYSAADAQGIRNIYTSELKDSLWSAPRLINEQITSASDEIYPMLSPDGKSLYFASKGLYGMGGYDLYVSKWDEAAGDWGIPVNMGFPYSSPYDDFLYINTDDGRYTLFASNRDCPADSVTVYVLEYEVLPVRSGVSDAEELRKLCALEPQSGKGTENSNISSVTNPIQEDENSALYRDKMTAVRQKRDSLTALGAELDRLRSRLPDADEQTAERIKAEILAGEARMPLMIRQLNAATAELQKIELDFLLKGIFIDPDALQTEADKEVAGVTEAYLFSKTRLGAEPHLRIQESEPAFDYSFRITEKGQFAQEQTLPDGLVYQIQLCSVSRQLTEDDLLGVSPVYERISGGHFIYSAGLFRSYAEALGQLNAVKKAGWRNATITAWRDSAQLGVQAARELEAQAVKLYKIRIWPADGQTVSELSLSAIRQQTDGDIIRTLEGAAIIYEIGPLDDLQKCQEIRASLAATGEENVQIKETGVRLPE